MQIRAKEQTNCHWMQIQAKVKNRQASEYKQCGGTQADD